MSQDSLLERSQHRDFSYTQALLACLTLYRPCSQSLNINVNYHYTHYGLKVSVVSTNVI